MSLKGISFDIEPTNKCNMSCPECWARSSPRPQGFMSWKLFEKIAGELDGQEIGGAGLNFSGEPTLHPQFAEMVWRMSAKHIVGFSTNGTNMTDDIIAAVVSGNVGHVNFSWHGRDKVKIYDAIQDIKRLRKSPLWPVVDISITFDGDAKKLERDKNLWQGVPDSVRVVPLIKDMAWAKLPDGFRLERNKDQFCAEPMSHLSILWDGKVTICCRDIGQEMAFGDVNRDSIEETWHGKEHAKMLEAIRGRGGGLPGLCTKCKLWQWQRF